MTVWIRVDVEQAIKPRLRLRLPWTRQSAQSLLSYRSAPETSLHVQLPFGREIEYDRNGEPWALGGFNIAGDARPVRRDP